MNLLYILLLVLWSAFNLGSTSSFLIYNKDHNKCVYAASATVVLTAPCDTSSTAQRFRWISSSRIISLSFSLCLGAEKIENLVKIILQPCNVSNPGQTWECKDETLFGLKGYPLHLNYGHDEPNVTLYDGTGVWSRWLIYGTEENLCSHGYQEMYSIGGNSFGKPCQFPFKSDGKWYADCTVDGRDDGQLWCATEKDYDSSRKWGFCPPKNLGSTSSFLIYNKDHNKCVYAASATVVLTAPCDTSSTAQRFRWISSSRIISLSFSLCLGAKKIENWVKIILQPCKELPVQTWECKDETLFGLKGYPLHLNYGHDEPNVMLYNETGIWSRWLIYGTEENLCSHGYQDALVPNITVFRQMQDRDHVIVMCSFGRRFTESSFQLSVEGEHSYTLNNSLCYSDEKCVFDVKVSTPVSFTCVHEINSAVNRHSETYTDHEEGVSLFYICFSSSIAVGLVIMTVAVIVTTIRSK